MTARFTGFAVTCAALCCAAAFGQENKTVLGPRNIDLYEGAEALKSGDYEKGLSQTLAGLEYAASSRERIAGLSNACAGYYLLDQPDEALIYCNRALEIQARHWRALTNRALVYMKFGRFEESEADIALAEELAPGARNVKLVRAMLLEAMDPVKPEIIVDDRRQPADENDQ